VASTAIVICSSATICSRSATSRTVNPRMVVPMRAGSASISAAMWNPRLAKPAYPASACPRFPTPISATQRWTVMPNVRAICSDRVAT
jgi:hypothetical protein